MLIAFPHGPAEWPPLPRLMKRNDSWYGVFRIGSWLLEKPMRSTNTSLAADGDPHLELLDRKPNSERSNLARSTSIEEKPMLLAKDQ